MYTYSVVIRYNHKYNHSSNSRRYVCVLSRNKEQVVLDSFDEKSADRFSFDRKSRCSSARNRKNSYDYYDTMQLLGMSTKNIPLH